MLICPMSGPMTRSCYEFAKGNEWPANAEARGQPMLKPRQSGPMTRLGIVTSPTSPYTARSEPVTAILCCAGAGSYSAVPWSVRTRLPGPQFALDWSGEPQGKGGS